MGKRVKGEEGMMNKLKVLVMFCERKMAGSIDINDFNEWEKVKERVELWIQGVEENGIL